MDGFLDGGGCDFDGGLAVGLGRASSNVTAWKGLISSYLLAAGQALLQSFQPSTREHLRTPQTRFRHHGGAFLLGVGHSIRCLCLTGAFSRYYLIRCAEFLPEVDHSIHCSYLTGVFSD